MTSSQIISAVVAATLVFWALGAYNRLTRLRADVHQRYGAVHDQLLHRHGLLLRWVQAMAPWLENDPQSLNNLRVACGQVQQHADHLRQRASAARRVAALRLAEDELTQARAKALADMPAQVDRILPTAATWGADADGGSALPVLNDELTEAGGTLSLARRQFNEAVLSYNDAVEQFPTWILAGLFRFRVAAEL
jgi:LemA protein